jgi:dihydroflavonol-4-reductase
MKKVLLTGASGYIGKHIALKLLLEGYEVRASVRSEAKAEELRQALRSHLDANFKLEDHLSFVELDLEQDSGWNDALEGIEVLMHTASPFPIASPKDENQIIVPAVEGTLRALKAAHHAGVKRVILTSSVAAIYGSELPAGKTEFDETIFTDVEHPIGRLAYTKSKTLAEAAAWDYVRTSAPEIDFTTINPVLVLGAPLDRNFGSSVSLVERILSAKDPMLPNVSFSIVDVKDVAAMHVNSIKNSRTYGERIIASSSMLSFVEIAKYLQKSLPALKIKSMQAPDFVIRILSLFDADIKAIVPMLGDRTPVSSQKAQDIFNMRFIPAEKSILETAQFLLE